jgi:3' exoribonuclease, RNase T-like
MSWRCIIKIYIDSEFVDDGKTIDLISIGLVSEDGREIYMQSVEFDPTKASQWVKDNVLAHLQMCPFANMTPGIEGSDKTYHKTHGGQCTFSDPDRGIIGAHTDCYWRTREQIRNEIIAFCDSEQYGKPEFIGWCCAFDFVVLSQLFGTMMEVPLHFPHHFKDLQNALDERGIPDHDLPAQQGAIHNALSDARYIKLVWEAVVNPLYRSPMSRVE